MVNRVWRSPAKVNLYLKIVGTRGNYHLIESRFLRVDSLFDEIGFVKERGNFEIHGFNFPKEQNIIYKTLQSLLKNLDKNRAKTVTDFFNEYSLKVNKRIPEMAGLGGGSSNSATFLNMIDEVLKLNLSLKKREEIVKPLGSDIIFFLHNTFSANVSGTGETVKPLGEETFNIQVFTPPIKCNTGKIYQTYRKSFLEKPNLIELEVMREMDSLELFNILGIEKANDLYNPALQVCPDLENYSNENFLFSGSGSSFFKI
ncbi:4-diphosphocytidyl-2C-methyl-D-erythritol 2-phosphate synthase [Thiovulum sp. ES]|nr:4-diphosphocytidyl-2C-methyl-D-erythritol 2-phosphate synthase [Thiovulum sp. ES]